MVHGFNHWPTTSWDDALGVALGERDEYTLQHSDRVRGICHEMGKRLGLTREEVRTLTVAALLHDVGKIGIPDVVLLKNGKLDDAEWEIMKTHSEKGEQIFKALEVSEGRSVAAAIRSHHEYFNGDGYPDGLAGEDIPLLARVIAVTDSYDAMTTRRSYQKARSHKDTMKIINEESGTKLDPYIVDLFSRVIAHSDHRVD